MSKKYNFLVLTNHRVHHAKNPVYSLVPTLFAHPDCASIHIGSMGNPANHDFFYQTTTTDLKVLDVNKDFSFDPSGRQFINGVLNSNLRNYDSVLMRLARPIPNGFMDFLKVQAPNTIFINDPRGIEKTSNKTFLMNFSDMCPPLELCYTIDEIMAFAVRFPIVLKPLEEYGGRGLLKIDGDILWNGMETYSTKEYLNTISDYIHQKGYLAMKFLKNVNQGDKRIIVVGGEILGASLRMPVEGSWLCNVAQGGTSIPIDVTPEEEKMINVISPILEQEGILIFGADTLVDDHGKRVLSEVNTLSVGGFYHMQKQTGKPIIEQTIQKIINYVDQKLRVGL